MEWGEICTRFWLPSLGGMHLPRGTLCCQAWPCVFPCTLWGYCWRICKDITIRHRWEHYTIHRMESSKTGFSYKVCLFWLKRNTHQTLVRMWRNRNCYTPHARVYIFTITLENNYALIIRVENVNILWPSNSFPRYII